MRCASIPGPTNTPIADAALPAGPSCSAIGTKGYKFKGTSPDGLSLALLKAGAAGKPSAPKSALNP